MISVVIPVYRNAPSTLQLADALDKQLLPAGETLEVIAVDDGSGDGTYEALVSADSPSLRVLRLTQNRGRAGACNAGALQARGELLFFMDCDCIPSSDHHLATHLATVARGYVACCGPIIGAGSRFWKRYQDEASRRRRQLHAAGGPFAGTTQNFSVGASEFRKVGGFDQRYRKYGFEDRDILVRLARLGRIGWCDDAPVFHCDELTLGGVIKKMQQAGGEPAVLFSQDHPAAYRALGYAAIDARLHPWLRSVSWLTRWLVVHAGAVDSLLDSKWMPYPVAKSAVKLLSALAFMQGSTAGPRG